MRHWPWRGDRRALIDRRAPRGSGSARGTRDSESPAAHDTQRLGVVRKAAIAPQALVERVFAGVAERRMTEVVNQAERFDEIFVQAKARANVRAIDETSSVCVSRVR